MNSNFLQENPVKEELLEIVEHFEEQGVDLAEEYPSLTWGYSERPRIVFQLIIRELEEPDSFDEVLH